MRPLPPLHLSALAAGLITVGLTAQTAAIVPPEASFTEGHHSADLPFGLPAFRTQILVDAPALATNGALLTGLRFRPDRSTPVAPQALPNVTVTLSHTNLQIGNLGTTFSYNITGPTTVVFQGTVQLPAPNVQPGLYGPAAWDIHLPFTQPYLFTVSQGNLLIDIVANNTPSTAATYWVDVSQPGGSATTYGAAGTNPTSDYLNLVVMSGAGGLYPRLLVPGQTIEFVSTLSFTTPPGATMIGFLPQPVPLDLTQFGAPTHFLYVDPIAFVPHNWQPSFIGFYSTVPVAVPAWPSLVNLTLYAQSALLDPTANAAGVMTSAAVEVVLGDPWLPLFAQQLDARDATSTDGTLLYFSPDYGAAPVLFEGTSF